MVTLPAVNAQSQDRLLALPAFNRISTVKLIGAARHVSGGDRVAFVGKEEDMRLTAITVLVGTRSLTDSLLQNAHYIEQFNA